MAYGTQGFRSSGNVNVPSNLFGLNGTFEETSSLARHIFIF